MSLASFTTFSTQIELSTSPKVTWTYLTNTALLSAWMFDESMKMQIQTTWELGDPFIIEGKIHEIPFKNSGNILSFEPEQRLQYSQLSSLSQLEDLPENHTIIDFQIFETHFGTHLKLIVSNCLTVEIFKHHEFYWKTALFQLKQRLDSTTKK